MVDLSSNCGIIENVEFGFFDMEVTDCIAVKVNRDSALITGWSLKK